MLELHLMTELFCRPLPLFSTSGEWLQLRPRLQSPDAATPGLHWALLSATRVIMCVGHHVKHEFLSRFT